MIGLDDLKNPVALGAVGVVILGTGLFFFLKQQAAESDADVVARHQAAEAQIAETKQAPEAEPLANAEAVNPYDESQGFMVPYRPDCPAGAVRKGAEPPKAFKEWCERMGDSAGMKHGWYAEWYPDGRPSSAGDYREGMRVGVWTRWFPNGKKRVQAEFKEGMQDGRLISWNERGVKQGEQWFAAGHAVVSR